MKWADGYAGFFRSVRVADTDRVNRDAVLRCPRYYRLLRNGAGIVDAVRDQNELAVRIVRPLEALQSSAGCLVKRALAVGIQQFNSLSSPLMIGGERLQQEHLAVE